MYQHMTERTERDMEMAWQRLKKEGIIEPNIIKPNITQSWYKCIKQKNGLGMPEPLPNDIVKLKQNRNSALIEASFDVVGDLVDMLKNYMQHFTITVLDQEGIVNYRINYANDIVNPGHYCDQTLLVSNGAFPNLINGVGMEVTGYENVYPNAQNWHSLGTPLRNKDKEIIGALAVLNIDGPCLQFTMQTVSMAALLIESRLQKRELLLDTSLSVMESINEPALLVDGEGLIVGITPQCLSLFNTTSESVIGNSLGTYLVDQSDIDLLSTMQADGSFYVPIHTKINRYTSNNCMYHVNRRTIVKYDDNNVLFLFTINLINNRNCTLIQKADSFARLIGNAPAFLKIIELARKASPTISNILIEGESGTGKELMAQAIHNESGRKGKFIAINCGSIPQELLNSELFGYVEGAFTGAKKGGSPGKFELADGGTIFLDEIGEMPINMQVSLLRFLEEKTVTRVGGNNQRRIDVRIIAATNRCLLDEVTKGNFREDLYYRLDVVNLKMVPLREHKGDIPLLAEYLLKQLCTRNNSGSIKIDKSVMDILCAYSWPGNVRQLQNVIESSLIRTNGDTINSENLPSYLQNYPSIPPAAGNLKQLERSAIQEALKKHHGNITRTAHELGITRKTLYKKMDKMTITKY